MNKTLVVGLLGLASSVTMAQETTKIPNIIVFGEQETAPNQSELIPEEVPRIPADGGDLLREALGVDAGRMGGHGLDPVIRGQGETRVNIILDGAYVHGGCPNRMDPPSSYAALETYEQVTILKGVQTLLYGGGGSGGTVLFERSTQAPEDNADLRYGVGGSSNGLRYEAFGDLTLGDEDLYFRGILSTKDADNYIDGSGDEVRSAYNNRNGNLILGVTPGDDNGFQLSYENDHTTDVLYAGAGMDSPYSKAKTWRLKYNNDTARGAYAGLSFEAYNANVDHLMDNYSLREKPAGKPFARAPSTTDTKGGRLLVDLDTSGWDFTLGLDVQNVDRDATRYVGMMANNVNTVNSYLWPGAVLDQTGFTIEGEHPLNSRSLIKAGLRYDYVTYDATKANLNPPPMGMMDPLSPNQLYTAYYGTQAEKGHENNLGFLFRYERDLVSNTRMFTGISRSMRTADATERYIASNGAVDPTTGISQAWVGNPNLDPEAHHQIDFGMNWGVARYQASGVIFADFVNNYILRDRAHGQEDILLSNNAVVYRNVDARLYGIELEGGITLAQQLRLSGDAAYVYSQNITDDRAIGKTPPLQGQIALDYSPGSLSVGTRVRMAAKQTRVEDDPLINSGIDATQTPGWSAYDVYGSYRVSRRVTLRGGVDNIFDKTYANHLNRANVDPFNPEAIQVNEPGVTGWLKVTGEF
jgi:iron complex outermembrane receptor protein